MIYIDRIQGLPKITQKNDKREKITTYQNSTIFSFKENIENKYDMSYTGKKKFKTIQKVDNLSITSMSSIII